MEIGKIVKQKTGYKAFVPNKFPPAEEIALSKLSYKLNAEASLALGKLDGITQLLPDLDFFIFMYVRKEATNSSQIEGAKATMIDAIKAETEITNDLPRDVDDIIHYIEAMNYGLKRLEKFPLSLRLIREVHKVLMANARSDHFSDPGEFRRSQNWIGGATLATASFVPPAVPEMKNALSDLEKFLHADDDLLPLIKTALMHAQFETIHPFLDGNGRSGRLLITFYLCHLGLIERPVLYLSEFFKKNRKLYYEFLHAYHNNGEVLPWINFFLEGVKTVSTEAVKTSRKINDLREKDMEKVLNLKGGLSENGLKVLQELYKLPIVNVKKIEEWTGLSRPSANALVARFVNMGILYQTDKEAEYARQFEYKEYLKLFA
jgi:Fic family protein